MNPSADLSPYRTVTSKRKALLAGRFSCLCRVDDPGRSPAYQAQQGLDNSRLCRVPSRNYNACRKMILVKIFREFRLLLPHAALHLKAFLDKRKLAGARQAAAMMKCRSAGMPKNQPVIFNLKANDCRRHALSLASFEYQIPYAMSQIDAALLKLG